MLLDNEGMVTQFCELTDIQWQFIEKYLPANRRRRLCLRQVTNAILYTLRTGCQWRNLPANYPRWQSVYYYFRRWKQDGIFEKINSELNVKDRKQENRAAYPSVVAIDTQSVKLAPMIYENRGLDPYKRVNGRKRQFVVDTGGRLWLAYVHAADWADGTAADNMVVDIACLSERLQQVYGDQAYSGLFAKKLVPWDIDFIKASRAGTQRGFVPIAKRWVVERSITWTNFFRRIIKDYEYTVSSSVTWLYLANIQIMLQRIRPENGI